MKKLRIENKRKKKRFNKNRLTVGLQHLDSEELFEPDKEELSNILETARPYIPYKKLVRICFRLLLSLDDIEKSFIAIRSALPTIKDSGLETLELDDKEEKRAKRRLQDIVNQAFVCSLIHASKMPEDTQKLLRTLYTARLFVGREAASRLAAAAANEVSREAAVSSEQPLGDHPWAYGKYESKRRKRIREQKENSKRKSND